MDCLGKNPVTRAYDLQTLMRGPVRLGYAFIEAFTQAALHSAIHFMKET
eukprot:XP_001708357.1 Hypothetical protein GL50803_36603 [Giardia lamblia ATCC 50803]